MVLEYLPCRYKFLSAGCALPYTDSPMFSPPFYGVPCRSATLLLPRNDSLFLFDLVSQIKRISDKYIFYDKYYLEHFTIYFLKEYSWNTFLRFLSELWFLLRCLFKENWISSKGWTEALLLYKKDDDDW